MSRLHVVIMINTERQQYILISCLSYNGCIFHNLKLEDFLMKFAYTAMHSFGTKMTFESFFKFSLFLFVNCLSRHFCPGGFCPVPIFYHVFLRIPYYRVSFLEFINSASCLELVNIFFYKFDKNLEPF